MQLLITLHSDKWPQNMDAGCVKPVKIIGLKIIFLEVDVSQLKISDKLPTKITGHGARMTRRTSFVVMSFSLLDSDDVMSSKGMYWTLN